MKKILHLSSRLLDYFWFWSILFFIIDLFNLDLFFNIGTTLLLPLLFIPIEAVLLKYFQTTLGRFIFGLHYNQMFTWKSAFSLAFRRALFLRNKTKTIHKKPGRIPHIFAIAIALLFSSLFLAPDATLNQACRILPFEWLQELKIKRNWGAACPDGWVKLTTSEELPFVAFFPKEPKFKELSKPVPHSDHILIYKEYSLDDYSLGYLNLPSSWVKWGSGLVFKGTLKQIISHEKGSILDKRKTLHEQYPAMNYKIGRGDNIILGRLILSGNTIYRLEVSHANSDVSTREKADLFFNSFHL